MKSQNCPLCEKTAEVEERYPDYWKCPNKHCDLGKGFICIKTWNRIRILPKDNNEN